MAADNNYSDINSNGMMLAPNSAKRMKNAKSNEDFIGVPPDMTDSTNKMGHNADFEDEEEETDAVNNFLTQADLFKSYAE